jgi:hypothetical protein
MGRVGDTEGKMERYFLTGQSPQWAVAPMEEEFTYQYNRFIKYNIFHSNTVIW